MTVWRSIRRCVSNKETQELTMGSLFDGIGGFPLAAVRSGIRPVWASEIEAFPIEVTKLRFPDMIHVGDITKLNGADLPPPCGHCHRGITLSGPFCCRSESRIGRGSFRFVYGTNQNHKGDERYTMAYVKARIPAEVYHLTKRENLDSILSDKRIRRFGDTECWFCRTPEDMLRYMEYTVLCEGKPYIATGGRVQNYPKFQPEDYVLLKLTPAKWEDKWYQWNQEVPANASSEVKAQAREFSELKIGYRGDLRFSQVEVYELTLIMGNHQEQVDNLQTMQSIL